MKYFDSLCSKLLKEADTIGGISGLSSAPMSIPGLAPAAAAGGMPMNTPAPATASSGNSKPPEISALTSQKKLQLAKLIALAIKTPVSGSNSPLLHKLRTLSNRPVVQGDALKQEKIIIKSISSLQRKDLKDILSQIKYIDADTNDESSTNFISPDEYASLINLARVALTTSANNVGGMDRAEISVHDITPNNVEDKITEFKNLLSQSL